MQYLLYALYVVLAIVGIKVAGILLLFLFTQKFKVVHNNPLFLNGYPAGLLMLTLYYTQHSAKCDMNFESFFF